MPFLSTVVRILTACVLLGHAVFAIGWWWLMPGGFPVSHARFWTNSVWPVLLLTVAAVGLWSLVRGRTGWSKGCAWILGVAALSATIVALVIYPDIKRNVLVAGTAVGLGELALGYFNVTSRPSARKLAAWAVAAGAFGGFMPWALRAEPATTRPLNVVCPWEQRAKESVPQSSHVSGRATVYPSAGSVTVSLGLLRLEVEPLLTFESTSRSGGWSNLSLQGPERSSPFSRLTNVIAGETGDAAFLFSGPRDRLSVADRGSVEIVAYADVAEPIYSHLNTFCAMTIRGHHQLELEFSPCGPTRFEPTPADYPVGRPARFAYCDRDRRFRVVEATSGEKGPFTALGEGDLPADAGLAIGIVDRGKRVATLHLDDWAAQLSTALSPTAGWGVAMNAIEFQRLGARPEDPVAIWITLAGTSVGRGWDTVGHAPGTYCNRIVIDPIE